MNFNSRQERLIADLVGSGSGLNIDRYYEHFSQVADRQKLTWREVPLKYSDTTRQMVVLETPGGKKRQRLALRALIHGEEVESGLALAVCFEQVVAYARRVGLGVEAHVLPNPWGANKGERYNPDYKKGIHHGNDDLARFLLEDGTWVDEVVDKKFIRWRLVNEELDDLPVETVAMLGEVHRWRRDENVVAVFDGHIDNCTRGGAYYFGYGRGADRLRPVAEKTLSRLAPKKPRKLLSGMGDDGHGGAFIYVNRFGLARDVHDGGLASVSHLMGIPLSAALELSGREPLPNLTEAFRIFVLGMIDLAARR